MGLIKHVVITIKDIVNQDSFYPEMPRKNKIRRYFENYYFLFRDKHINDYYNSFGLDIKNFKDKDDYFTEYEFIPIRNNDNLKGIHTRLMDYSFVCMLRDKFVFSQYLNSVIDNAVPKSLAYFDHKKIRYPEFLCGGNVDDFINYLKSLNRTVVVKNCNGECANGVFFVKFVNDNIIINNGDVSLEHFIELLNNHDFLVQDKVVQHEKLNAFNSSINTIRIVTIREKSGNINILAKKLRMGVNDSLFDNSAVGGVYVGIDDDGKLMKYGFKHPEKHNQRYEKHPSSDIVFENYQLPYWDEVKKLVLKAHTFFPTLVSIGWDVCITPDGPILIEGNDNWEMPVLEDCVDGLKNKYYELIK